MANLAIPAMIRNVLLAAAVIAVTIGAFWVPRDRPAAAVFLLSSAWGIANLALLARFGTLLLSTVEDKGLQLGLLGMGKVLLFAGGLTGLIMGRPYSGAQVIGLFAGISLCLLVLLIMAVVARMSGQPMAAEVGGKL